MRRARIKAEIDGYYHCMSRIIERRFILGDTEKERFRQTMRKLEVFCGINILTYSILDNHWHILLEVPASRDVSDTELIRRLAAIYEPYLVRACSKRSNQCASPVGRCSAPSKTAVEKQLLRES